MFRLLVLSALVALAAGARSQLRIVPRLVGVKTVNIEEFPYQVSVQYDGSHICGGSIIGPNKVLTAAHCTWGRYDSTFAIRHSSTFSESQGVVIQVASFAQHPKFDPFSNSYDVSVLTLTENINELDIAKPIKMVEADAVEGNRKAVITGWGVLSSDGPSPLELLAGEVEEVKCGNFDSITGTVICFARPAKDACLTDVGGPLVVDGKLVGINGFACAPRNYPDVFSNVAALRTFIDQN